MCWRVCVHHSLILLVLKSNLEPPKSRIQVCKYLHISLLIYYKYRWLKCVNQSQIKINVALFKQHLLQWGLSLFALENGPGWPPSRQQWREKVPLNRTEGIYTNIEQTASGWLILKIMAVGLLPIQVYSSCARAANKPGRTPQQLMVGRCRLLIWLLKVGYQKSPFSVDCAAGAANQPSWAPSPQRAEVGWKVLLLCVTPIRSSALSVTLICWLSASGRRLTRAHVKWCVWKEGFRAPVWRFWSKLGSGIKQPFVFSQISRLWKCFRMCTKIHLHNQQDANRPEFHPSHD